MLSSVNAAPGAVLLQFWTPSNESNTAHIDHSRWQDLLDRYLDAKHPSGVYRFDYANITPEDQQKLIDYLNTLQALDPRHYSRATQYAYWINLYNALTVKLVLDHYPVDSIKDIRQGLLDFDGPWNNDIALVVGQTLTLDDIEHGILRPIWRDNRIHYAVNCASLGCPNLWPQVYTADNTEQLLNQAAEAYINHPRGVSFEDSQLSISSIYDWYQVDFGGNPAGVLAHLQQYANTTLKPQLASYQARLRYQYDWTLNAPMPTLDSD